MARSGQHDRRTGLQQHASMPARPVLALAVALAVIAAAPVDTRAAERGDVPELGQRYELNATLDLAAGRLTADMTLLLTNEGSTPLDHVDLSVVPRALGFFSLTGPLTVDGAAVEGTWTTSINLRLALDVRPGETTSIRVPFRLDVGTPPDAFRARLSRDNGVLSFGQWFPIVSFDHDVYGIGDPQISFTADLIRLDLATTAPLGRDAVACPGLVSAPEGTGTSWACEAADVRDFSFVVNPRFALTTRSVRDRVVRVYTETVPGTATANLAVEGLIGLEEAFGRYPWPDLVLAEVGSAGGFSMEYPRMIHLTRDKVADRYVVYHEVAHQWFYGLVGNDQQLEPWVDEAFADFSARHLMGIPDDHCSTRPVDSPVFAWPAGATSGGDWTSCDGYFHAVFYRGTEFLTAVRAAMGDDAFFDAVRSWIDANRHGFVTGRELLLHLLRSTDANLLPIYARYLDEPDPRPYRSLDWRAAPSAPKLR